MTRSTSLPFKDSSRPTYIWIDYSCMPQITSLDDMSQMQRASDAVKSIPAYVERASVMLILAPVCKHKDTVAPCNYASWRSRGWCRMELMSAILAPKKIPTMVCTGSEATPFSVHCFDGPRLSAQKARFSCCDLGHMLNGRPLPCDKLKVNAVLDTMLEAKIMQLRLEGRRKKPELLFYNSLRAIFSKGLDCPLPEVPGRTACMDPAVAASAKQRRRLLQIPAGLDRLKALLGWTGADEAAGLRTGFTLVMCAALADDTAALKDMMLLPQYSQQIHMPLRRTYTHLAYMWRGLTPFAAAMIFARWDTVEVLIKAGASPESRMWNGMDTVFGAACIGNLSNARKFLDLYPAWNLNRTDSQVNVNALCVATLSLQEKQPVLKCMLERGGELLYPKQWGNMHCLLCAASMNEDSDLEAVKYLIEQGADVNGMWRPHDMKWTVMCKGIEFMSKRSSARIFKDLAMMDGATPLHFAAKRGDLAMVEALLEMNADPTIENKQGKTPLAVAMDFFGQATLPTQLKEVFAQGMGQRAEHEPRSHAEVQQPAGPIHIVSV